MPKGVRYPQLQDRDWLHRRYAGAALSADAIAVEIGCSVSAVVAALQRLRIPRRTRSEARSTPTKHKTRACARCGEQFLPTDNASRYCSPACRAAGPPQAGTPRTLMYPQLNDPEWLRATYETPRSGASIAEELGCDTQLVYYWLSRHDIPRRNNTTRTTAFAARDCRRCGTTFSPSAPAQLFCSERCQKQKPYRCGECGETFWSRISGLRESEKFYGTPMCTAACRAEARRGWLTSRKSAHLGNSNLAGTVALETDQPIRRSKGTDGYMRVAVPLDYPGTSGRGWMPEHRYVMEQALGRHLWPTETVHHIDGDRGNNELGNLQLRQGQHGKGARFTCNDCGSHNVSAVALD